MSSTTQHMSDEVWASVPQKRLPTAWAWAVVATVVVLVMAVVWVVRGGYVAPQLSAWVNGSAAKADSGTFDLRITVTNDGSSDVTITGFRTGASWLTVDAVTWPRDAYQGAGALPTPGEVLPITVGPRSSVDVRLVLVVDCDARASEAVPILIDARALAGTHETVFQPMPSGPMIESEDLGLQPWPVPSADWVCTPYTDENLEE